MSQGRYYSSTAVATTLTAPAPAGATSINVAATTGFPIQYPYTLVLDGGQATQEIVDVTGASGLVLTVTRGRDGSTAQDHSIGATVTHDVSARDFSEPQAHIAATSAHGVAGDIVGTTDTQTLSGKTLTDPQIARIARGSNFMVVPNANDTLVGRATTDTLTNKTLTAPVVDVLKSNGGSATLSLPQATDTLVGRNTTDTLTNKTLNGATLNAASTIGGTSGTAIAALPRGRQDVVTVPSFTTSSVSAVVCATSGAVSLVAGRKYRVHFQVGDITQTTSGQQWLVIFNAASGTSVDSAINDVVYIPSTVGGFVSAFCDFTCTVSGTHTFSVSVWNTGSASQLHFDNGTLVVDDIGG